METRTRGIGTGTRCCCLPSGLPEGAALRGREGTFRERRPPIDKATKRGGFTSLLLHFMRGEEPDRFLLPFFA
jgi:hypothetical protein